MNDDEKKILLAKNISKEILNKTLAHAFVIVKREYLKLRISSINGVNNYISENDEFDPTRINVVVFGGLIKKSWFG